MYYYIEKVRYYGIICSIKKVCDKLMRFYACYRLRQQAKKQRLAISWNEITQRHALTISFEQFFASCVHKKYGALTTIVEQTTPPCPSLTEIINNNQLCVDLLGAKRCFFTIPWHDDFKIADVQAAHFSSQAFYQDISIAAGAHEQLTKDIKVPWELSRFHYGAQLGLIFNKTYEPMIAQQIKTIMNDWLTRNPLLCGPNWVCPMEVAIRAVNWVWIFYFFRQSIADHVFWQNMFCSLYDHMHYLENNWEKYGTSTSNHYLADLVGYLYLCYFFRDLPGIQKKWDWCVHELMKEFEHQFFYEGTNFEGSTSYHRLTTEMIYHAFMLMHENGVHISKEQWEKLNRLFIFLSACMINDTTMIQIGDNDSGKLVWGITPALINNYVKKNNNNTSAVSHWPSFGLSLINTDEWHVSLRHFVYQKKQPTGHFHNDSASITVTLNGIPLLVDPGTYVYTASAPWRNRFRSITAHNTVSLDQQEPLPLDTQYLFWVPLPENRITLWHEINKQQETVNINTAHELYAGFLFTRALTWHEKQRSLVITDQWHSNNATASATSYWNFTLAPHIHAEKKDNQLLLYHADQLIAYLEGTLQWEIVEGWYSSDYGKKEHCVQLKAALPVAHTQSIVTRLIAI